MPPKVALLLCCAWCLYVFRKDAKWHPGLSPALWLPTFWIWRCGSRGISAWFIGGDPTAAEDTGWYDPAFFLFCISAGWYVLLHRRINWPEIRRSNFWLLLFFAYMAVSVLWAPDLFISTKRWVRAFGDLTMALVVATNGGGQLEGMLTVLRRCGYLLIPFSLLLAKYFPALGRLQSKDWGPDEWIGVAMQKNNLGMLCMVVGLWLLWEFRHLNESRTVLPLKEFRLKKYVLLLYAAMTLYLLNGGGTSRSVTSIVTLVICGILFWQFLTWQKNPALFWRRATVIAVAWLLFQPGSRLLFGKSLYDGTLEAMGRNPTLTERTTLWQDCIRLGMRHPFFGAGYMGFWTVSTIEEIRVDNLNGPEEAHSGYIEIFVQLGIVGLVLFLPVILSAFGGAWRLMGMRFDHGQFRLTVLVAMLIHNYAESGFPRPTYLTWLVFLLAAINVRSMLREPCDDLDAVEAAEPQREFATAGSVEEVVNFGRITAPAIM